MRRHTHARNAGERTNVHACTHVGIAWHGMARHGAAWHGMGQHGTAWHGMGRHGTAWDSMAQHGTAWHGGMAWRGVAWRGVAPHRMASHGMAWHGMCGIKELHGGMRTSVFACRQAWRHGDRRAHSDEWDIPDPWAMHRRSRTSTIRRSRSRQGRNMWTIWQKRRRWRRSKRQQS